MCSINGFNTQDTERVQKMNAVTEHRGPDATDIFCEEGVSLGHNRLSIIDLSEAAKQPMKSTDGRYVIVFNGEIYNFQELKKELTEYHFQNKSDTEVILAAYQKWGIDCFNKFNGIFAFVLWDTQKKELILARDRSGVKPLYYFYEKTPTLQLVFSSEIKGLLAYGIAPQLRLDSLEHYLRILYVPEPYTMFEGVMKLPAGSYGILRQGEFSINSYFSPVFVNDRMDVSPAEVKVSLKQVLSEAVKRQTISDRPVGVFLSGGLDSTIVLHHMAEFNKKIQTFSVGFDLQSDEQQDKFNADFNIAKKTAEFYKTDHHEVLLKSEDIISYLEEAIWHLDEPIANPTLLAQFVLSRFTKEMVTVVLGGDGGDELFGGYDRYRYSLWSTTYHKIPKILRQVLNRSATFAKLDTPLNVNCFAQYLFQKDKTIATVAPTLVSRKTHDFFEGKYFSHWQDHFSSFTEAFMDTDRQSWLVDESLMRTDKMTMASGVEARVPFLDNMVVDFARRLPLLYKVNLFKNKIILKETYKNDLPAFIFEQPKRGWFSPAAKWLRHPDIKKFVQEILQENYYIETRELFDWKEVQTMLEKHINKEKYNSTMLWALIIFQIWAKRYKVKVLP